MSWRDLDLSPIPGLPEPFVTKPGPPKPPIEDDIQIRLMHAERLQTRILYLAMIIAFTIYFGPVLLYQLVVLHDNAVPASWAGPLIFEGVAAIIGIICAYIVARPKRWLIRAEREYKIWRMDHTEWVSTMRARYRLQLNDEQRAYFDGALLPESWRQLMLSQKEYHIFEKYWMKFH